MPAPPRLQKLIQHGGAGAFACEFGGPHCELFRGIARITSRGQDAIPGKRLYFDRIPGWHPDCEPRFRPARRRSSASGRSVVRYGSGPGELITMASTTNGKKKRRFWWAALTLVVLS